MGISTRKGNGGYLGFDTRTNVTSSVGNISLKKAILERNKGNLKPTLGNVLFEDNFSTGDLSKWTSLEESSAKRWIVGQNTKGNDGSIKTIPSSSLYAAYISNDSVNNSYNPNTECHMYFDFDIFWVYIFGKFLDLFCTPAQLPAL